jgi:hypothetical protein
MAQRNTDESKELPVPNFIPTEFVELGKKRVETLMALQKDLIEAIQEVNQGWLARARSEANLNSELVTKLSSARSVPEQADAYQQLMGKRMEMLVEDSRRLISDSQKLFSLGTRFLNGSGINGSGG